MCNRIAARPKCLSSAIAMKHRSWLRVNIGYSGEFDRNGDKADVARPFTYCIQRCFLRIGRESSRFLLFIVSTTPIRLHVTESSPSELA